MNQLIFRRATKSDLEAIVAMLADDELGSRRENVSMPIDQHYLDAFASINSDPNQFLAIAESENKIAGCLQLTFIPGLSRLGMLRGQIESVRISADQRGKGIGRVMFDWAIGECRDRGCGLIQLTTDKSRAEAGRFYESLGFTASHDGMKMQL